jgi:hypothetical protein
MKGAIDEFELLRDISIVDLTGADDILSVFDADYRHKREPLSFMRDFVAD